MGEYIKQSQTILTPDQKVRIFVSSTIQELKQERTIAREAIREIKLHPVMFEGGSRPHPPQELYRTYLEQSHIYVGIFWESYGWVAPEMAISGIEDEYNLSNGKPRLVYVKDTPGSRDTRLEKLLERIRDEGTVCYQAFAGLGELSEFIKNDVMLLISERFGLTAQLPRKITPPPDYLKIIQLEIDQRGAIKRERFISDLRNVLATEDSLLIVGDPGIGKTFLLGALGEELDAIYISLRNKSAQQICSHLANHLSLRRSQLPRNLPSEDEARAAFQEELANNAVVLLIDDVDQNPTVAQLLSSLDLYTCRLVLAARSDQVPYLQRLPKYPIPAFDKEETELFLTLHQVVLPPGEFQNLYSASHGNPLYLYYFSQYQVSPLPEGLEDYQFLLWRQLSPIKQEIINFISFSLSPCRVADLHALLNVKHPVSSTLMETKHLLDSTIPLVKEAEGSYELFHPHFNEFVCELQAKAGLSSHYHRILGEYALSKNWVVPTAYHFLGANDPRMKEHLASGAQAAMLRGEWLLSQEFLQRELQFAEEDGDKRTEAQAHHLLSQVFQQIGRQQDASSEADLAIQFYDEIGDKERKEMAEIWRSTLLIEEARAADAIDILKRAASFYRNKDESKEAFIQLNLSFAYTQVSLFREGAEAAQRALDLFTAADDEHGIESSLVNLAGCVGQLGNRDLQRRYAEDVIEIANRKNLPRLKAAGLNHLAMALRSQNEYSEARNALEECIAISQRLGLAEVEIINISNLGNIFRDQELYDKAESTYLEALTKSKEHRFLRHEGHALELLSHIKVDRELYEEAVKLGTEALTFHRQFGEHLRIASTQHYLARSYLELGRKEEAARSYEDSAKHYKASGQLEDAAYGFDRAAKIWNSLRKWKSAASCISQGVRCALEGDYLENALSLLAEVAPDTHRNKYGRLYVRTLQLHLRQDSYPTFRFLYSFATYCKQHRDSKERASFEAGLNHLVTSLMTSPQAKLLNALAIALEQSDVLILPIIVFQDMVTQVSTATDHLHYRPLPDGMGVWTIGLDWKRPIIIQIRHIDEDYAAQRLAMSLSLILLANKNIIEKDVTELGGNLEDGFSLQIVMEHSFLEVTKTTHVGTSSEKQTPASFTSSRVPWDRPQPPTFMILDDDFEIVSNWAKHPENTAFPWVLMNVHSRLVGHCSHKDPEEMPGYGNRSSTFCDEVFG